MPSCATSSSPLRRVDNSLLSAARQSLQQNLEANRRTTAASERSFLAWRASWIERTESLAARLTRIESRLAALAESIPSRPVLSLVGNVPALADLDEDTLAW